MRNFAPPERLNSAHACYKVAALRPGRAQPRIRGGSCTPLAAASLARARRKAQATLISLTSDGWGAAWLGLTCAGGDFDCDEK
jgi:hypothetical protein